VNADVRCVLAAALLPRLAVVAWAGGAFPPAADGTYYHQLATRLAEGSGYTWLWPDGAVTPAAHYPVGYPAMLAMAYVVLGSKPWVAMLVNAALGALGALAVHDLLARGRTTGRRLARLGAIVFALHPAFVPYTAALMTEGVTAALLAMAAACAGRAAAGPRRAAWTAGLGALVGLATLVRPPSILLAPVLGALAAAPLAGLRARASTAALTTALALSVCAPWTVRNCVRMDRCALVSVNGGWNLLIGAQTDGGGWKELDVPSPCREVFAEAAKDACFEREARKVIASDVGAWLARVPKKLRATFDYFGAAPWYLHASNAERFPERAKVALGALETLAVRVLLAAALVAAWKLDGPRARARRALAAAGLVACVLVPGTLGYLALAGTLALLGPRALARAPVVVPMTAAAIFATAAVHAAFFGAGRYGLVVLPFVTALAFVRGCRGGPRLSESGAVDAVQVVAGGGGSSEPSRREESPSSEEHDAG
jgi:4-amino-4-deoxy-L-arabinose transferase-like glycosyltransferase